MSGQTPPPPPAPKAAPAPGAPLNRALDTHEITTWEPRTGFDAFAVKFSAFVQAHWLKITLAYLGFTVVAISSSMFTDLVNAGLLGAFFAMVAVSLIPFLLILGFVWNFDRTSKEPIKVIVITFLLGAVLAEISRAVNSSVGSSFESFIGPIVGGILGMFLVTGPIEEFSKWLAVRVHAFRLPEFDDVIDGAIYGIAAGAGFAWWENWSYIYEGIVDGANTFGTLEGAIEGGWSIVLLRGLGALAHPVWAGISGYYLGLAKFNPEHRKALIAKGLLIPALMHGASNSYLVAVGPLIDSDTSLWVFLLIDYLFVFWCAHFLYQKMKRNNDYMDALRGGSVAAPYGQPMAAGMAAGAPVTVRPTTQTPPPPAPPTAPMAVVGGPSSMEAALGRIAAAREHVRDVRARAAAAGNAAWVQWADSAASYLDGAEGTVKGSPDPAEHARVQREVETTVLATTF